jgi:prepilin-type processing-associated H-X9-DG protein
MSDPAPLPYANPEKPPVRWLKILGIGGGVLAVGAVVAAVIIPSMCRAREPANRIKCASNLRTIGQALFMYSNEPANAGAFPPDLIAVARTQDITADVFVCPSSYDDRPDTSDWADKMVPGNGFCSYVYYYDPKQTIRTAPATFVLMYEPLADHDDDGVNFLFADGHVDWLEKKTAAAAIKELEARQNPPPSLK